MTDEQGIRKTLDDGPWLTLLAWADLLEEQGDTKTATGMRWLVEIRRYPSCMCHNPKEWRVKWSWVRVCHLHRLHLKNPSRDRGDKLYYYHPLGDSNPQPIHKRLFKTVSEAYLYAAKMVGMQLLEMPKV